MGGVPWRCAAAWCFVVFAAWTARAAAQPASSGIWGLCGASGTISNLGTLDQRSFRIQLVDLGRSDPSLPTTMEGTPGEDGRAEGAVQRVIQPGTTCQGAGCPTGTLTWDAQMTRWTQTAGGAVEGGGRLTFQGPAGTCNGSWTGVTNTVPADVELLLRLSEQPPGSIDDLRAMGDPTGVGLSPPLLAYGKPVRFWVTLREGRHRSDGGRVDRNLLLPVEIEMKFDGRWLGTAATDENGAVAFDVLPPEDAPQGRSSHTIEVLARRGEATGSLRTSAIVERGLQEIVVAIGPIGSPQPVGATVTVKGRVLAIASGLFLDPVEADLTIDAVGRQVRARTDAAGFFSVPFEISSDAFDARAADSESQHWEGLRVSATPANRDRYRPGEGSVRFILVRQGELSTTVLTDRAIYYADELDEVAVSGRVTANGNPVAATVDLTYDGQQLAVVEAGADGRFHHRFLPRAMSPEERPGTEHALVAVARRTGYITSGRAATILVAGDRSAACEAGQARVLNTTGRSRFWRLAASGVMRYADLVEGGNVLAGTMIETTSSTAALGFQVAEGWEVTVAVGAGTRVEVVRYCREASGRVRIGLMVDKPGNIVIDRKVSAGATPPYEIEVVTPAVAISDLKTRYLVHVAEDGTTTVAVLDGSVSVARPEGGAETEVVAGEQITIRTGETPERSHVLALQGQVDPRLIEALEAAGGALAGGTPGAPDGAARLAELREIERAVMIDGRWVLVRTETGAFVVTIEQVEDYATLAVETGAIRPEERANLVQRLVRESREAFQALIRPEIEALQAQLGR